MKTFAAIDACPKCEVVDLHWIDQPRRATQQEWAEYQRAVLNFDPFDREIKTTWSGQIVQCRPANRIPEAPRDETADVVRVCRVCGHRWECE